MNHIALKIGLYILIYLNIGFLTFIISDRFMDLDPDFDMASIIVCILFWPIWSIAWAFILLASAFVWIVRTIHNTNQRMRRTNEEEE